MVILLDCRPLQYAGYGVDKERPLLILSTAALLSAEQAVKWLYLVDHTYRPGDLPGLPEGPGTPVGDPILITRRAFPGRTGWRIWYDGQIPRLAKKYRADLIMTTAGIASSSMRIPQCVWMPERANPEEAAKKRSSLYSARLAKTLFRAAAVFCFSQRDKTILSGRMPGPAEDKIVVLSPVPDAASIPLSLEEKEQAKAFYAGGKEYFLANVGRAGETNPRAGRVIRGAARKESAGQNDLINLLKAFSLFKKRQRSNMQLVLVGKGGSSGQPDRSVRREQSSPGPGGALMEKLSTYKYREELHWFDDRPEDRARMTAAAYAVLFPFGGDPIGTALLSAWKAEVPVIVPSTGRLSEIAGEAALLGSPDDPTQLSGQLMLIYKDEALRQDLIEKGKDLLHSFSGERPVDLVWRSIRMAMKL